MKHPDGCTPENALVFEHRDPPKHVLLYARVASDGAFPRARFFKPAGTEYAGPGELADMGYVPVSWKTVVIMLGEHLGRPWQSCLASILMAEERGVAVVKHQEPKEDA